MDVQPSTAVEPQARREETIRRMQRVQQSIRGSRQPAVCFELMEPGNLGRTYPCIVEQFADLHAVDPD